MGLGGEIRVFGEHGGDVVDDVEAAVAFVAEQVFWGFAFFRMVDDGAAAVGTSEEFYYYGINGHDG